MKRSAVIITILALILILLLATTPILHYLETREILSSDRMLDLRSRDGVPRDLQNDEDQAEPQLRIVVSLTTVPERINGMKSTISSLLRQTLKPDEIAVHVPMRTYKGKEYVIPDWLTSLTAPGNRSRVKMYRPENDYGPATKLLFTLKREHPESKIIVVDDDIVYPPVLVETLVKYSNKYPDNAITTYPKNFIYHGRNQPPTMGRVWSVLHSQGFRKNKPIPSDIVMGVYGFVVKPRFFTDDVFSYEGRPDELRWVDDIHFSGQLNLNGVDIYSPVFDMNLFGIPVPSQQRRIGLITTVNADGHNNNKGIAYYWGLGAFQQK